MQASARRIADLAALVQGEIVGDAQAMVERVAAVDDAQPQTLTFAVDDKYLGKALESKAAAVLVWSKAPREQRNGKTFIAVPDVRAALAAILQSYAPQQPHGEFTHPSAILEPGVVREADVWIGPGVIVREGATLCHDAVLLAGAYVGKNARIGAGTLLHPRATVLDDCIIGDDCVLQAGCVIGGDGFGFARVGSEQIKIPQIGNVVVGDKVEIGANTTIDRAVTGSTTIGNGTKIDNLVQIGHNVQIGEDCTLCAHTGIAGSTRLGKRVITAGQVGIIDHLDIGEGSIIFAASKVIASVPPHSMISGHYAKPHRENMEQQVLLRKLPKLFEQVRMLMHARGDTRKSE